MFITWNFKKFVNDYIAPKLRTDRRIKWIETLTSQISLLYTNLYARRNADVFLMQHTGQVASLEHLLNSLVPIVGKPIVITDGQSFPNYYLFSDEETTPTIFDTYIKDSTTVEYNPTDLFIFNDDETVQPEQEIWLFPDTNINDVDFVVLIDYVDVAQISLVEDYVNIYKIAGSEYKIILY